MAFWVLSDSTQLTGLEPTPQGVARLTNGKKSGGMVGHHDQWNDRGEEDGTPPPAGRKTGMGQTGLGGYVQVTPPQLGKTCPGPPGGTEGPIRAQGEGGQGQGDQRGRGGQPPKK